MEQQMTMNIPALALRGLTIFPNMLTTIDVEREASIRALERCMEHDEKIFLVTQREISTENPEEKDLYTVGTVSVIRQILRISERTIRVLMEGKSRAKLRRLWQLTPYLQANVELIEEKPTSRYEILKKNVDYDTARNFQKIDEDDENYPNVKGIWLEEDYIRTYPYETLACDVIGFTSNGNVGTNGIEASYNSILNGTDGREYGYQDESASLERTVKEPESGSTVVSTIDLQVQSVVEKHILKFNEKYKNNARKGEGSAKTAVMVMNPQNGEILA